jgi:transcriptional regulator with XRE-family HTH domain
MDISTLTEQIRGQAKSYNLVQLAELSGVTYSWLTKFVDGRIQNPTVANLQKLEKVFKSKVVTNTSAIEPDAPQATQSARPDNAGQRIEDAALVSTTAPALFAKALRLIGRRLWPYPFGSRFANRE